MGLFLLEGKVLLQRASQNAHIVGSSGAPGTGHWSLPWTLSFF